MRGHEPWALAPRTGLSTATLLWSWKSLESIKLKLQYADVDSFRLPRLESQSHDHDSGEV
jgi:hypothetical protein